MLKGISPLISPELLKVLAEMGHGDGIVLADAHFPAYSLGIPVLRADGTGSAVLMEAVLPLFELDSYVERPVALMAAVPGDSLSPGFMEKVRRLAGEKKVEFLDRFDFYDRARQAFAVVVTGEIAKYGNILLKKGVGV